MEVHSTLPTTSIDVLGELVHIKKPRHGGSARPISACYLTDYLRFAVIADMYYSRIFCCIGNIRCEKDTRTGTSGLYFIVFPSASIKVILCSFLFTNLVVLASVESSCPPLTLGAFFAFLSCLLLVTVFTVICASTGRAPSGASTYTVIRSYFLLLEVCA